MTEYKKILIIKLGALGDFIFMTGLMSAVREKWPKAHITLMTGAGLLKLAQASGYFDAYIIDNRVKSPLAYFKTAKTLAYGGYDLILDFQMQRRTRQRYYALGRLLSRKPFCWAEPKAKSLCVTQTNQKLPFMWGKSVSFDIPFSGNKPSLSFCKANPDVLKQLPQRYVLFVPGCSPAHPYKRWPSKSYQTLGKILASHHIPIVVLGTNDEKKEIEAICADNPLAVNFCNKSALWDIPQIAEGALAVVGNDTGPQHMAELSGIPAITLFAKITACSAHKASHITNLVGEKIEDISVDEVACKLQFLWHKP